MPDFAMPEHHAEVIAPAPLVLAVNWPARLPSHNALSPSAGSTTTADS